MRRQPSHIEGMLTRDEIIRYYTLKMGLKIEDFRFYRIYGLFRLAGIVQQLYYRYAKGDTQNKAFKNLWMLFLFDYELRENHKKDEARTIMHSEKTMNWVGQSHQTRQ